MKTPLLKSFVVAVSAFCLVTGASANVIGSGNVTTETRSVTGFHSVELLNSADVVITQGDTEGVVIQAEDNLIPLIETKVENGALRIGFTKREEIHFTKRMVVNVSAKNVDAVQLAGSGNITSKSLKADNFSAKIAGSGTLGVDYLETGTLAVSIAGSGDVKLAGKATRQTVEVAGSGDYEAAALKTATAAVSVLGSGDCEVAVSETLEVNIAGSGDVSYYGKPKVTKHVTGTGDVDSLGAGK